MVYLTFSMMGPFPVYYGAGVFTYIWGVLQKLPLRFVGIWDQLRALEVFKRRSGSLTSGGARGVTWRHFVAWRCRFTGPRAVCSQGRMRFRSRMMGENLALKEMAIMFYGVVGWETLEAVRFIREKWALGRLGCCIAMILTIDVYSILSWWHFNIYQ